MATYTTHQITVQHKDGSFRQHHVMASDDANAIHQVPIEPEKERIVGIRRTQHANTDSKPITHAVSFKTNDLFGGDGHVVTHYISVTRGSVEKEIDKMTKKNPQLGTPLGAHKIQEGVRITYSELVAILEGRAAAEGRHAESEWVRGEVDDEPAPKKPSIFSGAPQHAAPAKQNRFSTMQHGTAKPVHHSSIEDAHLHAHLQALRGGKHSVIHNGVTVATHEVIGGQHHVTIH